MINAHLPVPLLAVGEEIDIVPYYPPFFGKGETVLPPSSICTSMCWDSLTSTGVASWDGDSCPSLNPLLILLIGEWVAESLWASGEPFGPCLLSGQTAASQRRCPSSVLQSSSFAFSSQVQQALLCLLLLESEQAWDLPSWSCRIRQERGSSEALISSSLCGSALPSESPITCSDVSRFSSGCCFLDVTFQGWIPQERRNFKPTKTCIPSPLISQCPHLAVFPLSRFLHPLRPWGSHHLPFPICHAILGFGLLFHLHLEYPTASLFTIQSTPACPSRLRFSLPPSTWSRTPQAGWHAPPLCFPNAQSISITALITTFSTNTDLLSPCPNNVLACWRKCHSNLTWYSQGLAHCGEAVKAWGTKLEINKSPL